jgi:hypothetical protein
MMYIARSTTERGVPATGLHARPGAAKDGRMLQDMFRRRYPHLAAFASFVHPKSSSAFWRRMQT